MFVINENNTFDSAEEAVDFIIKNFDPDLVDGWIYEAEGEVTEEYRKEFYDNAPKEVLDYLNYMEDGDETDYCGVDIVKTNSSKRVDKTRELHVYMSFYLQMNENETKEEAEKRFYEIMKTLQDSSVEHKSSYQVYDKTIQACE